MSYRIVKGKYVINKGNGVYCAFTKEELTDLLDIVLDIKLEKSLFEIKDNRNK